MGVVLGSTGMAVWLGVVLGAGAGVLVGYALPAPAVLALCAGAGLFVAGFHLRDRQAPWNRF